jgi:hypothetical protein
MWVAPGFAHGIAGRRVRPDMTVSGRCRFPIVMAFETIEPIAREIAGFI